MNIAELKSIINSGESKHLEFKTSTASLKSAFETLCAFLNTGGGRAVIGVKDDGRIVGQHVTDQTNLEIANLVAKFEPPTAIDIEYVSVDAGKYVIVLTAHPNPSLLPYVFDGKPFWRIGSSTRPMPQQHYQQMLMERINKNDSWELAESTKVSLADLDEVEIFKTINESIRRGRMNHNLATNDPQEALLRLKLLINGKITNAAVVLFCRDPMPYYPQCLLRLAKFKQIDKSDMLDSQMVSGNAFVLLDTAENFLMRHMSIRSKFIPGKMAREDIPDYPPRAVREAMVNAICHRDYAIKGGSISFFIYSDRLEITSHGSLPFGITIEDLQHRHESQPRNEHITQVMYKRGIIESVGTGTEEMIKESRAMGKPDPQYLERGNTFVVCFKAKGVKEMLSADLIEKINERQINILELLFEAGALNSADLLVKLNLSITERTLRRDLKYLMGLGLANVHGKGPSTVWMWSGESNNPDISGH